MTPEKPSYAPYAYVYVRTWLDFHYPNCPDLGLIEMDMEDSPDERPVIGASIYLCRHIEDADDDDLESDEALTCWVADINDPDSKIAAYLRLQKAVEDWLHEKGVTTYDTYGYAPEGEPTRATAENEALQKQRDGNFVCWPDVELPLTTRTIQAVRFGTVS